MIDVSVQRGPWVAPLTLALVLAAGQAVPARAVTVDLSATPPDLTRSADPNIAVSFDDSGSMGADVMGDGRPFDHAGWNGVWRCAAVIDPRSDAPADLRSHVMNGVYYNPRIRYLPPLRADGRAFPDADATLAAVWNDGIEWNRPLAPTPAGGTTGFSGAWTCPGADRNPVGAGPYYWRLKAGVDIGTAGAVDLAALYDASHWEAVAVPVAEYPNWANWWAYYRTRNLMTRTALSRVFGRLDGNLRVVCQNLNRDAGPCPFLRPDATPIGAFSGAMRTRFFDWLQQLPADGETPARAATLRVGDFFAGGMAAGGRQYTEADPYWNGITGAGRADLACRQNFHLLVTDGYWNEPDPSAPVLGAQASRVLPDGVVYATGNPASRIFWNVVGATPDASLANIAFDQWARDLRPDLADRVPAHVPDQSTGVTGARIRGPVPDPAAVPEVYFNPANDPATWQHVVQFMVTLGAAGELDVPGDLAALRRGAKAWPQPVNNAPQALDDTWHAAINGRGGLYAASDPDALVVRLTGILETIASRRDAPAAGSLDSSVLTVGALGYHTGYDSGDWSGSVTARPVDSDSGAFGSVLWDAGCLLTGGRCRSTGGDAGAGRDPDTRVLLTAQGTGPGQGAALRWASLSLAQRHQLDLDPASGAADGQGARRLDFLRGDRGNEGALFRARGSLLGAVVNAQPLHVGAPDGGYSDSFPAGSPEAVAAAAGNTHEHFAHQHRGRAPTLYVASADGMLHAFEAGAAGGRERWAYVPYTVFVNLPRLTAGNSLQPMLDSTPVARDVFVGGQWRTLLVGALGLGGRGVYALDITDPDASEADPGAKVLWEFNHTSAGGAALGYTYARPNIARLAHGRWVVLVAGGYFPNGSTDPAASDTGSSLFVLDAQTGALVRELKTGSAPQPAVVSSGLAAPVLGDYQGDQIDDVAFAGDLQGHLWRFDLTDADPSRWAVDLLFRPLIPGSRPITMMPRLFPDALTRRFDVVFGTGKYLGLSDRATRDTPAQAFYGLRDYGRHAAVYPISDDSLLRQDLDMLADGVRILTDAPLTGSRDGWFFLLDTRAGERSVVTPTALFDSQRAILVTLIPGGDDPCNPGRDGAVLVVNAANGGPGAGLRVLDGGRPVRPGYGVAGAAVAHPPVAGMLPVAARIGGGRLLLPGITLPDGSTFSLGDAYWRRRSWRALQDAP
jgi:type IV pilus assembly protein PilY1